jgi:hypothetical protein
VVDKKTLNLIFVSMISLFSTAVPLLIALLPDPATATDGQDECALPLSVAQTAALVAFRNSGRNMSCAWNIIVNGMTV